MAKVTFRKIVEFVIQLIFWLPFSFVINALAIGPVFFLTDLNSENAMPLFNIILFTALMWGIAFLLSKLRQRIKGHKTDEFYSTTYDEVTKYYNKYGTLIDETHRDVVETEHYNTIWGWVGILTAFIAIPLQLVSLIAAYLGLFIPKIYSTSRALPDDEDFSLGNRILHSLFNFVIIPGRYERDNLSDAKGFKYVLFFILTVIAEIAIGIALALLIKGTFMNPVHILAISLISMIVLFFIVLSIIICIIKYSILIVYSYSEEEGKQYIIKLAILGAIAALFIVLTFMFF